MAPFKLIQRVDEPFHVYFSRFNSFVEYLKSCGEYFYEFQLEDIVLKSMNDETRAWFNSLDNGENSYFASRYFWPMFKTMARIDQYKREEEEFDEPLIVVHYNEKPLVVNTPNACSLMSEPLILWMRVMAS